MLRGAWRRRVARRRACTARDRRRGLAETAELMAIGLRNGHHPATMCADIPKRIDFRSRVGSQLADRRAGDRLLMLALRTRQAPELWGGLYFLGASFGISLRMFGASNQFEMPEAAALANATGHVALAAGTIIATSVPALMRGKIANLMVSEDDPVMAEHPWADSSARGSGSI